MNTITTLLEKIAQAKPLDFGDIIDKTINLFKKVWSKGLLVVVLIVIASVGLSFLFTAIGLGGNPNFFMNGFVMEDFFKMYFTNVIYAVPQTILISTVTIALVAAFYRMCEEVLSGKTETNDYFYFFGKGYFSKVFMLGILNTGIALLAQLLLFIPYIYVFVPLSYFSVVLANNPELSEFEVIKASFALGNKKWLISFGTMFVAGLMGMLGVIGCGIGVLFTMSIMYLPVFLIYREAIGSESHSEIDEIGTSVE